MIQINGKKINVIYDIFKGIDSLLEFFINIGPIAKKKKSSSENKTNEKVFLKTFPIKGKK